MRKICELKDIYNKSVKVKYDKGFILNECKIIQHQIIHTKDANILIYFSEFYKRDIGEKTETEESHQIVDLEETGTSSSRLSVSKKLKYYKSTTKMEETNFITDELHNGISNKEDYKDDFSNHGLLDDDDTCSDISSKSHEKKKKSRIDFSKRLSNTSNTNSANFDKGKAKYMELKNYQREHHR